MSNRTTKQLLAPFWDANGSSLVGNLLEQHTKILLGPALAKLFDLPAARGRLCVIQPLLLCALTGTTPKGTSFSLEDMVECGLRFLCKQPRVWPLVLNNCKRTALLGTKCWFAYHDMQCIIHLDPSDNTLVLCLTDDD